MFWRWPAGQLWILLGKGGVAAPSSKWSRSFGSAARSVSPVGRNIKNGWFVQLPTIGGLNQPPRLRPLRRLRGIFLVGAATPPSKGGEYRLIPHCVHNPFQHLNYISHSPAFFRRRASISTVLSQSLYASYRFVVSNGSALSVLPSHRRQR